MDSADALLIQLAKADAAARPNRPQFLFVRTFGGETVSHPGLPDEEIPCQEADILDLEEAGYLRFHPSQRGIIFDVTSEGRRRASQLESASEARAIAPVGDNPLDWSKRVLPVLEAIGRLYADADPALGVGIKRLADELGLDPDDEELGRVVYELSQTGYLNATLDGDQALTPLFFRLEEKGLKVVAGWPTDAGADLLARLLVLIDQRIAAAESPDERSKWERLRDGVLGVGRDVAAEVLAALATGAVRGMT
jgi:hypothetical protein